MNKCFKCCHLLESLIYFMTHDLSIGCTHATACGGHETNNTGISQSVSTDFSNTIEIKECGQKGNNFSATFYEEMNLVHWPGLARLRKYDWGIRGLATSASHPASNFPNSSSVLLKYH